MTSADNHGKLELDGAVKASVRQRDAWCYAGDAIPIDHGGPRGLAFDGFEDDWLDRPLFQRFEFIADRHAQRNALDDGNLKLSYAGLREAVRRLASQLGRQVPRGGAVGIFFPNDGRFPLAMLACMASGHPYVPIDPKQPAARVHEIATESAMHAVICDLSMPQVENLPAALSRIDVASSLSEDETAGASQGPAPADVDAPACLLYTSGSTGKPKGICNSQRGLLQRAAASANTCHVGPDDRMLLLSGPWTIAGTREILTTLLSGACLCIADVHRLGIGGTLEFMRAQRVTLAYTVPSLLRTLLDAPDAMQACASLRIMRVAGDVTRDTDLEKVRRVLPPSCLFLVSYSSTEMPNAFQWFVPRDWQPTQARVPVGHPQQGIGFRVVDDAGQPVAQGETGELVVRTRHGAIGYWKLGKLEPGPFEPDPELPGHRIQRTGDLVRQLPDGLWELVGRKDRQIKIRGQRIDPGEVEAILRKGRVRDAVVIARRAGTETIGMVAYVVPDASGDADGTQVLADLKDRLAAGLPAYMRPSEIRMLDQIPLLPGFKPDVKRLERMDQEELERQQAMRNDSSPVRDAVNAGISGDEPADPALLTIVERAWREVLKPNAYREDMRWDEMDADSLKTLEFWFQIEQRAGAKVAIDILEPASTPRSLAAALGRQLRGAAAEETASPVAGKPMLFMMPGILGDEPLLSHFRAAFGGNVRMKVIDYPEWRGNDPADGDFSTIVDAAFRQVIAEPGCDSYALAGYSYGGYVAFETARRLMEAGRKVHFVGLIDSRMWGMSAALGKSRAEVLRAQALRYLNLAADPVTVLRLVRKRFVALGRYLSWAASSRPNKAISYTFYRERNYRMRVDALRRWKLKPLAMPVTLFLSDQGLPDLPEDYGWGGLCTRLSTVHVGGTHASMLESPRREVLRAHVLNAILQAAPYQDFVSSGWTV
ncbi:alpha/beta fold hydrolase [Noviherbaspirillum galbum]|uniref:AMP-binding protein n=1 Tax=Noviherbaspirillum galbum TaxID=2709383 RepID=A0A6B3SUZ1_9BURK|nr:alpha/beta fold hydrolase [Noviherbaspirillum galbum]NEX62716.1 AMP-binding protein [Noviherbaspirillum galbum]